MRLKDKLRFGVLLVCSVSFIVFSDKYSDDGWQGYLGFAMLFFGVFGLMYLGAKYQQLTKFLDKKERG